MDLPAQTGAASFGIDGVPSTGAPTAANPLVTDAALGAVLQVALLVLPRWRLRRGA